MKSTALLCMIGSVFSCTVSVAEASVGQHSGAAGMLYGHGVYAYFAGHDAEAEQYLSRAIQSVPNDPRPYYFRAMSRLRRGDDAGARQDMQLGADAEALAPGRWAVGSALQRVQGTNRLLLEEYRQRARVGAAARQDERNRARYERVIQREPELLRRPVEVPLEKLVQPTNPRELIHGRAEPNPPTELPETALPQRESVAPSAPAMADPFADDPLQASDTEASGLHDSPPAEAEPVAGDDNLFAAPEDTAAPTPTPDNDDASSGVDEDNPFGF